MRKFVISDAPIETGDRFSMPILQNMMWCCIDLRATQYHTMKWKIQI